MIEDRKFLIKAQLIVTIEKLESKQKISPELIVDNYMRKYKSALGLVVSNAPDSEVMHSLKTLKGEARGYVETSSDYMQEFLEEMGRTEKLISEIESS